MIPIKNSDGTVTVTDETKLIKILDGDTPREVPTPIFKDKPEVAKTTLKMAQDALIRDQATVDKYSAIIEAINSLDSPTQEDLQKVIDDATTKLNTLKVETTQTNSLPQ
jgi:hypothetical protein